MIRGVILPWLRHVLALLLGWLGSLLIDAGFDAAAPPDLGATIDFLALVIYFFLEKWLKPMWIRWFGESQPGELAAPAPPKVL